MINRMDELHFDHEGNLKEFKVNANDKTTRFVKNILENGKITGEKLDNSSYVAGETKYNWHVVNFFEFQARDYIESFEKEIFFKQDDKQVTLFFEFPGSITSKNAIFAIDKLLGGHLNDC